VPIEQSDDDWVDTKAIGGGGMKLGFQRVPEGKVVKNRLHLDLDVPDLEAWTLVAEELGGRRQGAIVEEQGDRFQVMNDPEGNEFCLVCLARILTSERHLRSTGVPRGPGAEERPLSLA